MTECWSRFILNRWVLEDLPDSQMATVAAHVSQCANCQGTVGEIKAHMAQFDDRADEHLQGLHQKMAQVRKTAPSRQSWAKPLTLSAVAVAAAAMLMVVIWPLVFAPRPGKATIQYKGDASCKIFVKRGEKQFQAKSGRVLKPGDQLRFEVSVDAAGFLSVFSIDAQGKTSPFYPPSDPQMGDEPFRIGAAGKHILPGAVELDDAGDEEIVVVIFAKRSFDRRHFHAKITRFAREGTLKQMAEFGSRHHVNLIVFRFPKTARSTQQ